MITVTFSYVFTFPAYSAEEEIPESSSTTEDAAVVLHLFQVPDNCPKGYKLDWGKECRKIFGFHND